MVTAFFVVIVLHLFFGWSTAKVSQWGDPCNFTAECSDHRMVCSPGLEKCECDRFHEWQGTTRGCIQVVDLETILNITITSTDNKANLERNQKHIFIGPKIAGFFVMAVTLCCPIVVAIHCLYMKRKDRILHKDVKEIKERTDKAKQKKMERMV